MLVARLIEFDVTHFYPVLIQFPDAPAIAHMDCAYAGFKILDPTGFSGREIQVIFTDGRFLEGKSRKQMERACRAKKVFEFSVPSDYFHGEYTNIGAEFVEGLEMKHNQTLEPTSVFRAPKFGRRPRWLWTNDRSGSR